MSRFECDASALKYVAYDMGDPCHPLTCENMPLASTAAHLTIIAFGLDSTTTSALSGCGCVAVTLSDMLTLHTFPHSSKRIIEYTGLWTATETPCIPIFKQQFMLPFLKLVAVSETLTIIGELSICYSFILLDMQARRASTEQGVCNVLEQMRPHAPSAEESNFVARVSRVVQQDIAYSMRSISSLLSPPPEPKKACTHRASSALEFSAAMATSAFVNNADAFAFPSQEHAAVKPFPTPDSGLKVFEFFSGIGGMRLALPCSVRGVPVAHITAFDCSDVANQVYTHNFCQDGMSELREVLIEGIKQSEVDGERAADMWTMSPPCQPYTRTRKAKQLGSQDTRNRGFFSLMELLLRLAVKPRWIVLENVASFGDSDVCALFKRVLVHCGFGFAEYVLSPVQLGIPNHRLRYYLTAEYGSRLPRDGPVQRSIPLAAPIPMSRLDEFVSEASAVAALLLPLGVLEACWASKRISVVGAHDTETHCFTKGYGRIVDKSTGSCYLENAQGPLSDARYAIDRSDMTALQGRVRWFHPRKYIHQYSSTHCCWFYVRLSL